MDRFLWLRKESPMLDNRPAANTPPRRRVAWLFPLIGGMMGAAIVFGLRAYNDRERSFMGRTPPDFPLGGTWIKTDGPLSLANLRGKVVLVQFSFIGCVFCRQMDPYLSEWHEKHSADGFKVIEIDDGTSDTLDEVREWVAKDMIRYPVYYDAEGAMTAAYGIHSYPSRFLIDRDGKVVWEGGGWGGEEGVAANEIAIRKALAGQ
jgi:thiol-disulfide isomerase/thioredoxin